MQRLYVHISVDDFTGSLAFYSALFGIEPVAVADGSAEWRLDDPTLDFAISRRSGGELVLARLGLELASAADVAAVHQRFAPADAAEPAPDATTDRHWMVDPAGVLWEAFHRTGVGRRSGPSNREYIVASRGGAERLSLLVRDRRLQRRRAGVYHPYA